MTPPGWRPRGALSFAEWRERGQRFAALRRSLPWAIGDHLRIGEQLFGARAEATAAEFGEIGELVESMRLAERFPVDRRRAGLSFAHHVLVADLDPDLADRLLERAEAFGWTVRRMRREVRRAAPTTIT